MLEDENVFVLLPLEAGGGRSVGDSGMACIPRPSHGEATMRRIAHRVQGGDGEGHLGRPPSSGKKESLVVHGDDFTALGSGTCENLRSHLVHDKDLVSSTRTPRQHLEGDGRWRTTDLGRAVVVEGSRRGGRGVEPRPGEKELRGLKPGLDQPDLQVVVSIVPKD